METLGLVAGAALVVLLLVGIVGMLCRGGFFTTIWWFFLGGAEFFGTLCEALAGMLGAIFSGGSD